MTELTRSPTRNVVVVLGSGRSGTSLIMQVLAACGLQVSQNLISSNASNPEGFFEDDDIKDAHAELIKCLGVTSALPLPVDWLQTPCARAALKRLEVLLANNLAGCAGIFGFKNPHTGTFLPMWTRIFNRQRVVPKYVMAVREPAAVVSSFLRQYGDSREVAELVWLVRNIEALHNTAIDCFIVHYEDWFDHGKEIAEELLHFTGLVDFSGNLEQILRERLKPSRDRSQIDAYEIKNPYVRQLYEVLKGCRGADFERSSLIAMVQETRQAMDGFAPWHELAQRANLRIKRLQGSLETLEQKAAKVKELEARIRDLELERQQQGQLEAQLKRLQRQVDQFMNLRP
jgi:hypothetical protein